MNKLTKQQLATRDELIAKLRSEQVALAEAITKANDLIDKARGEVENAVTHYNEALVNLEAFRDEIVEAIDEYMGEKSDKWQESDKASSYNDWKGEFEGADLSALEITMPDDIEDPGVEHAELAEGWPEQPE